MKTIFHSGLALLLLTGLPVAGIQAADPAPKGTASEKAVDRLQLDATAITGNLTSPPTRHDVAGGVAMVTFGLASTERRFENGTWHDVHTNFYNVSVFRKLAEHAYASLEKGQRVILAGKLKVRHWEANGRTGTSVDLEATSIGPDLMFGVATFVKDGRAAESSGNGPDARATAPDEVHVRTITCALGILRRDRRRWQLAIRLRREVECICQIRSRRHPKSARKADVVTD